jgi:biotin-dependent carboxylase-like uncharacterized protein
MFTQWPSPKKSEKDLKMPVLKSLPLFEVIKAGVQTTVQDLGRHDYLAEGVPISGAMDFHALKWGNLILKNPANAPGLEIPFHQFQIVFRNQKVTSVVIIGDSVNVFLNEVEVLAGVALVVQSEDRLKLSSKVPMTSARTYFCCVGGIEVPEVLKSKSTYFPGKFGGFSGRALIAGDLLHTKIYKKLPKQAKAPKIKSPEVHELQCHPHSSPARIPSAWIKKYLSLRWKVHPQSSRMGIRLMPVDPEIQARTLAEVNIPDQILSQGAFFGVIQLTPDGTPIILGADAQTIGGYPIIACVDSQDLWKCGQWLPGQEIKLKAVRASTRPVKTKPVQLKKRKR